jgi:serine/threonine protein kinase
VFYFLLTGRSPFADGTIAKKLLDHQKRPPDSVQMHRPDVPAAIDAIIQRMLSKNPSDRFQEPIEVVTALGPWTREAISPPPDHEMPRLSRAVRRLEIAATPTSSTMRHSQDAKPLARRRVASYLRNVKSSYWTRLIAVVMLALIVATALYGLTH